MSSKEDSKANDTIVNMVTNLKPKLTSERLFITDTPAKRMMVDSDSSLECISSPLKKFKPDRKPSDVFYIGSPREVRRIRADLVDTRNTVSILEKRITHMHTLRKEMEIVFERENKGLKAAHEKDRKTIEELEAQLQSIRMRELTLKEELIEVKHKCKTLKEDMELKIQELESNVSNMTSEIAMSGIDEKNEMDSLKRRVAELEHSYKTAQEETEAHKKLIEELNKKSEKRVDFETELELKKQALYRAQLKIKELEFSRESYLEFQQQAKSQQHKLSTYADLERENARMKEEVKNLRNEVHNKLILEEEVHDLKGRLIHSKELETKYTILQVSNAQTEMYLEEFRDLSRSTCEYTGSEAALPRLLRTVVERLQQQEITLTAQKIQLESQMSTAVHEAKVARDELEKSVSRISSLQDSVKHHQNLIHRMQKKLSLISGERDSYRKQLDSYERDLTICMNPASIANPGAAQLQTQQERIASLEKLVDGYRDMVHKLESDLQTSEPGEPTPIKIEQVARLQEEITKLKNENALLRERKDNLEIQLEEHLVGHDSAQGRIVHMSKNPLAVNVKQRETEKERLEEEIVTLKRKIRKLEDGLEASKLGDVTIDHQEVKALKEQLHSSEQQMQRLKEYFKNSMQEFRNVIYMLMGFKIDKTSNSNYKLTSMYADKSEDYLCFHLNNEGALDLLENAFSTALEELVELHLRHQGSIPVFLSALTMDLFNNKTLVKTYDIDDDEEEMDDEEENEDVDSEDS